MLNKSDIGKLDFVLIGIVSLIVLIGILAIYSGGFDPIDKINSGMYKRQILWFVIGFVFMIAGSLLDYKWLGDFSLQIYGIVLFVVIVTTFFGTSIRNIRAWISFGAFSIQPSEFMKLATLILLAKYLEIRERDIHNFRELFIPAVIVFVPVLFILLQPDFGTAMIFIPLLFVMLFMAGADVSQLFSIVGIALIAVFVPMFLIYQESIGVETTSAVFQFFKGGKPIFIVSGILFLISAVTFVLHLLFIKKYYRKIYIPCFVVSVGLFLSVMIQKYYLMAYQKERILVFLNPEKAPRGSGYNVIQSKIAVGSGGFFGKGFLQGSQAQLGFLPEKTSDFIFGVVAEEWGFFGAFILVALMFGLVFRGIQISLEAKDKFGALLAVGITSIVFFHFIVNVGMAIGIMPVTGVPLCFVSYGGSSMVMLMFAVGILLNIGMKKSH